MILIFIHGNFINVHNECNIHFSHIIKTEMPIGDVKPLLLNKDSYDNKGDYVCASESYYVLHSVKYLFLSFEHWPSLFWKHLSLHCRTYRKTIESRQALKISQSWRQGMNMCVTKKIAPEREVSVSLLSRF